MKTQRTGAYKLQPTDDPLHRLQLLLILVAFQHLSQVFVAAISVVGGEEVVGCGIDAHVDAPIPGTRGASVLHGRRRADGSSLRYGGGSRAVAAARSPTGRRVVTAAHSRHLIDSFSSTVSVYS